MSFTAVSFGHCWRRLLFAVFLSQVMISVDEFIRLVTCIRGWWNYRLFLLLADGFSCRLFCNDILVDQSLTETALSPYYGHSLVFVCRSLLHRRRLLMCVREVD